MTSVDLRELTESHSARLHNMDPLLPVPGIPQLAVSDELIGVDADGSVAVGVARLSEPDPDEMVSTWGALRQYQLVVRLSGPEALDPLLTEWDRYLAGRARPGDEETSAVLRWPSRDTAPVPALVRHGFAPLVVCAARPTGTPMPPATDLFVREDVRGGGVGRALVAEGHRALEEAGVAVTLLHHSLPNPRSTPFWYSNGYRPLWTVWQRRPAVLASVR